MNFGIILFLKEMFLVKQVETNLRKTKTIQSNALIINVVL